MTENLPAVPEDTSVDPQDVPSDSRGWAVAAHLLPFVSLAIIGPLFVWLIKRDEDDFIEDHAREALNFQLSLFIYMIASVVLMLLIVGFILFFVVAIFGFVWAIIAGVKAANGEQYRYPLTMRMVKKR